jgi:hypothetical protein
MKFFGLLTDATIWLFVLTFHFMLNAVSQYDFDISISDNKKALASLGLSLVLFIIFKYRSNNEKKLNKA